MKRQPKPEQVDPKTLPSPTSYANLRAVWESADLYRLVPRIHGYPANTVRLWAPIDAIHEFIVACATASQVSLASAMYGWDDAEINSIFLAKLKDERVPVQLSLDSSQAAGRAEVPLVAEWCDLPGNSLAVGRSAFGAISHDKTIVYDGVLTTGGSTNLSEGGERKQNNECYAVWDAVYAAETTARLAVIHDEMLMAMAAKGG